MNPDPSICLRCGGPVSEITRRCTFCGAERLALGLRKLGWEREPSTSSYVTGAVFAFLCLGLPLLRMALPVSALLLRWHPRTRRHIAAGALLITAVWTIALSAEGWSKKRMASPGEGAAFREAPPGRPGSGTGGGIAWVGSHYEAALQRFANATAVRAGVELAEPPLAWQTARYASAASRYPDVERYWKREAAYAGEMRRRLPAWSDSTLRALGREGRITGPQVDAMLKGRDGGVAAPERWALEQAVDSAALAYHRYLVSIDARVSYDATHDRLVFDRQAELDRVDFLEQRMQAAERELNAFMTQRHQNVLVLSGPLPPR